jgi:hypothetical protein
LFTNNDETILKKGETLKQIADDKLKAQAHELADNYSYTMFMQETEIAKHLRDFVERKKYEGKGQTDRDEHRKEMVILNSNFILYINFRARN